MDAFAVSICKGLAMKKLTVKQAVIVGAWFGGFQALMPTIRRITPHPRATALQIISGVVSPV